MKDVSSETYVFADQGLFFLPTGSPGLARERISPYRKDVLTKGGKTVGGGDITRKKKLLEKQKAGKKRAKMVGKVEISQEAFWSVLQKGG